MVKERVYMYSCMEADKAHCGVTTDISLENVRQNVLHNYSCPRHIHVVELPDMAIDGNGQPYGPVPVQRKGSIAPMNMSAKHEQNEKCSGGNQSTSNQVKEEIFNRTTKAIRETVR